MRLDLSSIINTPGGSLPFSCRLDLSHLEFYGEHPICEPLFVEGVVRNRAGALMLTAHLESELHWICDRCAQPFIQKKAVSLEALLASSLEQEDQMEDNIYLLEGTTLPLAEIAETAFVLEMDTKHLCSDDCKGLCPRCGKNLNEGPCQCKSEVDPRLAALAQLLNQGEGSEPSA
ncbi:MAG: DUF177 domain-containing protein [Oscillospiraceae bacterium]|nr:DUF177 domain-containing protein [Oscillospiraceae bacterium]